jgi:hypothetical protein
VVGSSRTSSLYSPFGRLAGKPVSDTGRGRFWPVVDEPILGRLAMSLALSVSPVGVFASLFVMRTDNAAKEALNAGARSPMPKSSILPDLRCSASTAAN